MFTESRCGLRQGHGIATGEGTHVAHDMAMVSVARFVRQSQNVTERLVVSHKDARFLAEHGAGAKAARSLAGARLPIDPVFGEDLLVEKFAESQIGAPEGCSDHILGFIPR